MKRGLIALLFLLVGCIPATSSTITVSDIDQPSAAMARVDAIARGLGFYSSEPSATDQQVGIIVRSYDSAPVSGIFIVVRFEHSKNSMEVYFAERAQSFSTFALQKRDQLVDQIAAAFGRDKLTMKQN